MKPNGTSRETFAAGTIHPTKKGDVKVLEFKSSREVVVQFLTEGQEVTTVQATSLARGSVSRKKQVRSKIAANSDAKVICNNCGTTDESIIGYDKARKNGRALNCKPCANKLKSDLTKTPYAFIGKVLNMQKLNSRKRKHALPPYKTAELYQWALNNGLMHLFNIWKVEGYEKYRTPSIDRIDSEKPYSLDNIRLLTWRNNQHLGFMEKSVGYKLEDLTTGEISMASTKQQVMEKLHVNRRSIPNDNSVVLKGVKVTPLTTEKLCEGTIRAYSYKESSPGKLFENTKACCEEMGISEYELERSLKSFEPMNDWCYYENKVPVKVIKD